MKTLRTFAILGAIVLLASTVLFAQRSGAGTRGIDPTAAVTLDGPVVAFSASLVSGLPTLTVDDAVLGTTAVRLGPYWFLSDAGFTATAGQMVRVVAYPCTFCDTGYVAESVENLATGATLVLRSEDGYPVWLAGAAGDPGAGRSGKGAGAGLGRGGAGTGMAGAAPGGGRGAGLCQGLGPDLSAARTVSGRVESFTGAPGVHHPVLSLAVDGEKLDLAAGPYRVWIAAGFTPEVGQTLTATYAPVHLEAGDQLVLLSLSDPASGLELLFRDPETGLPVVGRGWRR